MKTMASDLLYLIYMLLSGIGMLYQLENKSFLKAYCQHPKTYCLRHVDSTKGLEYTFTAEELENRCNTLGGLPWLRLSMCLSIIYVFTVYSVAVYIYYNPIRLTCFHIRILNGCVALTAIITGVYVCSFLILPSAFYYVKTHSWERNILTEVWTSPLWGVGRVVLRAIARTSSWVFTSHFRLDEIYIDFTCVAPIMEDTVFKCPKEFDYGFNWRKKEPPSKCDKDFYCVEDCLVSFPPIVINSLGFIFASLVVFSLLLRRTRAITEGEFCRGLISRTEETNKVNAKGKGNFRGTEENHIFIKSEDSEKKIISSMKDKETARAAATNTNEIHPRKNSVRKRTNTQTKRDASRNNCNLSQTKRSSTNSEQNELEKKDENRLFDEYEDVKQRGNVVCGNNEAFKQNQSVYNKNERTAENGKLISNNVTSENASETDNSNGEYFEKPKSALKKTNDNSDENFSNRKTRVEFSVKTVYYENNCKECMMKNGSRGMKRDRNESEITTNGLPGNTKDKEGYDDAASENVEGGIDEVIIVEDESEFYMSGFRL